MRILLLDLMLHELEFPEDFMDFNCLLWNFCKKLKSNISPIETSSSIKDIGLVDTQSNGL